MERYVDCTRQIGSNAEMLKNHSLLQMNVVQRRPFRKMFYYHMLPALVMIWAQNSNQKPTQKAIISEQGEVKI